jgi:CO/xanthine dehydrogenase Mo-binding subunit
MAAGVDPLEYRRRNLKDPRGLELLDRLARLANWTPRKGPAKASGDIVKGRGVSYTKYELVRTYVGAVADVEVNRKTGTVRVERVYMAHDCGQIINPDGVKNQLEGGVVQTVSRTLIEDLKFDRSRVTSLDWKSYPILTFPDVPEVVLDLIDRPTERPWGVGEPGTAVVPSAISNAIYDAVGIRMRSVPFARQGAGGAEDGVMGNVHGKGSPAADHSAHLMAALHHTELRHRAWAIPRVLRRYYPAGWRGHAALAGASRQRAVLDPLADP